jgi:RimJ/RimL family protein N-acetyltransferase
MIINRLLIGEHIELRMVELADCNDTYLQWMVDYETNYYMETRWNEQTVQTITGFVNSIRNSSDSYLFAIVDKKGGIHIGNIKLGPINSRYNYADLSYFIGNKNFHRKGYAKEAIKLVCQFAFVSLQLHRIQAGVIEGNDVSRHVLEATGFTLEGRLRDKFIRDDGYLDHFVYSLINE